MVLSGGIYIPPEILARWESPPAADRQAAAASERSGPIQRTPADLGLSGRQAQVLRLLLEGKSNKLICRELDLAESTVKNHVTLILKALNVTSRTQAVIAAARTGLVFERAALPDKASAAEK